MFSDASGIKFRKKDYQRLFLLGAVLGGLIFILIYGIRIINPCYTAWIYYGDNDLKQHFMGWCHYRNSAWHFPVGLIDNLSYPYSMSTIYTDSIPGVALIFKLISGILPADFQYFGLVGLLSFILCGGTSVILLKRFVRSPWLCLLICPFFTLSFPIIQRMYYHTALAAHWIIFLAFIIWAYDPLRESSKKSMIIWALMGFLCVSVHSYYIPMAGMILMCDRVSYFIKNKKILPAILPIVTFCVAGVVSLWLYGAFYGSSSGVGYGLGTFVANYNTFFNPTYYGFLLPELPLENYFQYEGCGYLGAGILALSLAVDVMLLIKRKELKEKLGIAGGQMSYIWISLALLVVSFFAASLPTISFGSMNIGTVPYPEPLYKLLSIFRSNGRFIWIGMYVLMLYITVFFVKFFENRKNVMLLAIAAALILQGIDLTKMIREKYEAYAKPEYTYETMWDSDEELARIVKGKSHFVFLYDENDINMETAFYAYKHDMTLNNFYFARDINDAVDEQITVYVNELADGLIRDDTVYIMKLEDYEVNADYFSQKDIDICMIEDHVVFASK